MALPALMASDAAKIFVTTDFGEAITYTGSTGAVPTVALIEREEVEASDQDRARTPQRRARCWIPRADIPEPRRGLDKVSAPLERDGSAVDWRVTEILVRDNPAAWAVLLLR